MASKQKILAVSSLLSAAIVWGLIWYPYRVLEHAGVSGETATLLTYFIALLFGLLLPGHVWRELRVAGWWGVALTLCAGWTNLGYVLAMLGGEVMRVLLLFYLAPLWTVLLARWLLGEKLDRYGYAVIALSLGGAMVMLWQPSLGLPLPQNRAEWIGLSAGIGFALTNVLARRIQHLSVNFKAASVWFGTALLTVFALLYHGGFTSQVRSIAPSLWVLVLLVALVLCATSFTAQYGLTSLPANQSIVLFMFELVVAAAAAYFLAGEKMDAREIIGAVLIVAASLFSGKMDEQLKKT
ncbi:MAG: DMT family transporter [Betaproteobacteria bacterium]|nr:DMT family transporter [Betaproteobacteria bacterium]MDE2311198.1 DMT family transporter [Betaproteobacteria bacterium]